MPDSADSVLISFGLLIFLFSLFSGQFKSDKFELPELNDTKKLALKIMGIILFSIGILFHWYSIKPSNPLEKSPKLQGKIRLSERNIKQLIRTKGFEEIVEFPVTQEIISAFHDGFTSYQIRLCSNDKNQMNVVPANFTICPESKTFTTPHLGPLLDLNQFK